MAEVKPKCLTGCYYFDWLGLQPGCFHPDQPKVFNGMAPAKCSVFESEDAKRPENKPQWWKDRLTKEQFKERISCGSGEEV